MTIEFLSAFGLGALVTAIFQALFNLYQSKRLLSFNEKKEAYIGLLQAYHEAAVNHTEQARLNFAYWQIRCELVGSKKIALIIEDFKNAIPGSKERIKFENILKDELRKDLGVS